MVFGAGSEANTMQSAVLQNFSPPPVLTEEQKRQRLLVQGAIPLQTRRCASISLNKGQIVENSEPTIANQKDRQQNLKAWGMKPFIGVPKGKARAASDSFQKKALFRNANEPFIPAYKKCRERNKTGSLSLKSVLKGKGKIKSSTDAQTLTDADTEDVDPPLVEVTGSITTNTIWHKDTWYKVIGDVEVTALLVIEPGTVVFLAGTEWSLFDPRHDPQGIGYPACDGGLVIKDGGAIIAMGTPSEPIFFEPYDDPDPENNPWPGCYHSAIHFESTASAASRVAFCFVECAYAGFKLDNLRLETPIQNCLLDNCIYGIKQTGTQLTDIFNNAIYASYVDSIDVDLKNIDGSDDAATEIVIENNTCLESLQNNITVHGVNNEANAGMVRIVNNIVMNSYYGYGLCLCDGYMKYAVACNGYYRDYEIRSHLGYGYTMDGTVEVGAVVAEEYPFDFRPAVQGLWNTAWWQCLCLPPNSSFVDTGCGGVNLVEGIDEQGNSAVYIVAEPGSITAIPPLVGSTTQYTHDCDEGLIDLGYHASNFDRSNAGQSSLSADLDKNGVVNAADEAILKAHLSQSGTAAVGDLNGDGFVDLYDLRILRSQKGKTGCIHPNLSVTIDGDSTSISNLFDASATNGGNTDAFLFFLDGCYLSQLFRSEDDPNPELPVSSFTYKNGAHKIKVVGVDLNGNITLSSTVDLNFDNSIDCLTCSPYFSGNNIYRLLAFNHSSENIVVNVETIEENSVFQTDISGSDIDVSIPSSTFVENYYDLIFDVQTTQNNSSQTFSVTPNLSASTRSGPLRWPIIRPISEWGPSAALVTIADDTVFSKSKRWRCGYDLFKSKGYNVNVLNPKNLNWKSFCEVMKKHSIHYWYHLGHGKKLFGSTRRIGLKFPDRIVVSHKRSDYIAPPASYENLPGTYELTAGSMFELGLQNSSKLKFVFVDSCYSAYEDIDCDWAAFMAQALGMYSENNYTWGDQIYIGWTDAVVIGLTNVELNLSFIVEDRFVYWFFIYMHQYPVLHSYQRAIGHLQNETEKDYMRNLFRCVGPGISELITIPDN
jgi:hypothetical protein